MKTIFRAWWSITDEIKEWWNKYSEWVGFAFYIVAVLLASAMVWVTLDAAEAMFR